jgi:hypothetical protein
VAGKGEYDVSAGWALPSIKEENVEYYMKYFYRIKYHKLNKNCNILGRGRDGFMRFPKY